jgi:PAS domain S-box-containing protein
MTDKPTHEELEQKVKELEEEAFKRKQTEEALRASEARLSLALTATSDGIWDWDIVQGLTYASDRCGEIFGIEEGMDIHASETWTSRIHPDDYDRVSQCMKEHLKGNAPYEVEYRHRHGDGEYRWQSSRGMALFDGAGHATRMVGSIRDISARKLAEEERERLEAQLQQAQKMEALGTLAGGVAHDFNNLLTAIMGNIELSQMYGRSEEKISKSLIRAKKACKRAKNLTKQFLTFAKNSHSGKRTNSIGKLIQYSGHFAVSGTHTRCEFSVPEDLFFVDFNSEQMKQVIINLVSNASEAMNGEGTVEVRAENIYPDAEESGLPDEGKQIKISIRDHGIGIAPEVLAKIFDPYFSSKETVTQKGMGLGLSICYSTIEDHKGRIEVESEVGTGTTFNIYLPASER